MQFLGKQTRQLTVQASLVDVEDVFGGDPWLVLEAVGGYGGMLGHRRDFCRMLRNVTMPSWRRIRDENSIGNLLTYF